MTNQNLKTVKYEPTPFRVMERLKRRFMGKTYLKYTEERTKLSRLRLHPKGNMADHLGEMRRIMETISVVGRPVDGYAKTAILIGSLPREYDNIVQTFLTSHTPKNPEDPPNYEQLEQALEMAYDHTQGRRAEGSKGDDDERALYTGGGRGRANMRGRGRGRGGRGRGRGGSSVGGEVAVEDAVAVVVTVVINMEVASIVMSKIIKYETVLILANVHLPTNGVRVRLLSVISKVVEVNARKFVIR
ncbi:unnamed protein product [Phytophthora fragariaefolia]|uniref:Unnamed protein product n=1 Tax=Phytophthora fragariaefolia TaxID=1490495 RepID=A0A9W6UAB6_9STRA|nr:unnamed protein product [Phytophthora fragariaefolia]